ncbi:hypothetical protein GE09DRAFT_673916 [Coniochaeta sp. 2T2.1]|nr:hypothetical protein GE09DRAFT_673916 [Coniochaeta sp. 2T2.1]
MSRTLSLISSMSISTTMSTSTSTNTTMTRARLATMTMTRRATWRCTYPWTSSLSRSTANLFSFLSVDIHPLCCLHDVNVHKRTRRHN